MQTPPAIRLDDAFVIDAWTRQDASGHRAFAEEDAAARAFGWTVEEARSLSDAHYVGVVDRFAKEWADGTRYSFAIREVASGEAVGAVELQPAAEGASVRVSYLVSAAHRGKGLAALALEAALRWAQHELSTTHAVLTCHGENVASRRVAMKCRFVEDAREGEEVHFSRHLGPGSS